MQKRIALRVRPVAPADEAAWRRLWLCYCDFYAVKIPAHITNDLWRRIMDPAYQVHALVAEGMAGEVRGRVIGSANYILHPYTWGSEYICYLEDLFVLEDLRRNGAGRALIEALVGMAKKQGWARVYWHTHEQNKTARSLYDGIVPRDPFVRYVVRLI